MSADALSATFAALADPTRRAILARLATGEATVSELAEPFAMSLPAVTKHLKVLQRAGLAIDDIDLFEVNEAFAPVPLAWLQVTGADPARLNVNGGAIALGHPLGCTGAKLTATLVAELHRRSARYGMVSMCIGGGMGAAGIFERM